MASVLEQLDARALMMGHTVTRSGRISSRFNGTIYRADVGMGYGRPPLAAVIEGGELRVYDPAQDATTAAYVEPPQGEGWPAGEEDLAPHVLESYLAKAEIKSTARVEFEDISAQLLDLERREMRLRAVFGAAQETAEQANAAGRKAPRRYQHQVAAYRLNRQLGMDMVPVTVLRKVDGTQGTVQVWLQRALDLQQLEEYDDFSLLSGLEEQFARARAFTALIGLDLTDRVKQGKMVLPTVPPRIMLADNGRAFSDQPTVAPYLPEGCGPVGPAFLQDLERLDSATLRKDLGKLLSGSQIRAILERRDDLQRACAAVDPEWSMEKVLKGQAGA